MSRKFLLPCIVLTLGLVAACSPSPATSASAPAGNIATEKMVEYVGAIAGSEFFVAIAVGPARDVLAYVCDGMGTDFLFKGTTDGKGMALNSQAGAASLNASPDGKGFSGTFTANGKTHPFTTGPVQDYGGLYHVTSLTEFEAEGKSQGGATLKISLTPDKEQVQVTVLSADGKRLTHTGPWRPGHDHREPTDYSESWLIYLNDGQARGGHIKTSIQVGVRHIDPVCPP